MIAAVILTEIVNSKSPLSVLVKTLHEARIERILIVVHSEAEKNMLGWFDGNILVNGNEREPHSFASIVKGFEATEKTELHGIMVCNEHCLHFSRDMIVDLLQAFWKSNNNIVLANINGRRSPLPFILENSIVERLTAESFSNGIESVVSRYPDEVGEVFFTAEGEPQC